MLKCVNCSNNKQMSKGDLTPGGKQTKIVTCKLHGTFQADYDEKELPCNEIKIDI